MAAPPAKHPVIRRNAARWAMAVLGDRWTLLILRDAFLGVRQFGAWQTRLGITPTVLNRRLKALVEAGVFARMRFREVPPRVEYHLTEKGLGIYGVALMILQWEQRWFPEQQEILLWHAACGRMTKPLFVCGGCGKEIDPRDVRYEDGPGAGVEPATERRTRRATTTAGDNRATHRFLEHAVDILGDHWSWEIVGAAFLGLRRFDELQANTGIATNILSNRLRRLAADGIFERRPYQERPPRHEYVLSDKGRDFYAATVMLLRWGDRWLAPDGPPLLLFHKTCGQPLDPRIACGACSGALDPHDVSYEFADGSVPHEQPLTRAQP